MRAYVGVTAQEVKDLLESGQLDVSDVYAATGVFIAQNNDLDEEEIEYTLSLVAAEDAVELKSNRTGSACVLAFEVPDDIISETFEMSISLSAPLTWEYLECCFEVSDDGEELTWFATQEIANNISAWLA
ncbi:hypothetical protein MCEMRE185_01091 [Candidatus Nanopelagicaceae bacterium]